jgi:hypothetical protein
MPLINDDLLHPIFLEGLLPAVSVWRASFIPHAQTTTCEALRLNGWEGLQLQFGTSEHIRSVVRHEACDCGEDGIEPAYDETLDYYFLRPESISSRDAERAAVHEIALATIDSIDVLVGTYEIRRQEGVESVEVLAGLRFNLTEGYHGNIEASFGFLQRHATQRIEIGPASIIFRELPAHIRVDHRVPLARV